MHSVSIIPIDVGTTITNQRVVIYARVSTLQEEQDSSYTLQVNELIKVIEANHNYTLVSVYADKESGLDMKTRPAFQKMMELARLGGIDLIYTKSVSRFGRNAIDVPEIIRELRGLGVTVIFDKENISTKDFADEFLLNILSGVAEEESRQISSNLRWTFSKKMSKGRNTTVRIYGYKIIDNEFILVPTEASIVRQIYTCYLEKVSYTKMISLLHKMGVKSPLGMESWSRSVIESILLNEKYCGDALLGRARVLARSNKAFYYENDTKYLVRNNHEPIITREVFEFVQDERKRRTTYKRTNASSPTLKPESKFFYCVDLGKYFIHKVERPKNKYEIPVLVCTSKGKRMMLQYNSISEGVRLVTAHLVKHFSVVQDYYQSLKNVLLVELKKELQKVNQEISDEKNVEDKLASYNASSALQVKSLAFAKLDQSLSQLKSKAKALADAYSIELTKEIYTSIYIEGLTVTLLMNLTNNTYNKEKPIHLLTPIEIPYTLRYKPVQLSINIAFV